MLMVLRRLKLAYATACARIVLRSRRPFIIGITGSAGKTTTTEMIAAVLSHESARPVVGMVAHTVRNMNDDHGLPLTILRYDRWPRGSLLARLRLYLSMPLRSLKLATVGSYPDILVLEYGTHWEGHLKRLAQLARPNVSVVTVIGPAHLDRLKTIDAIVQEKGAVVQAVAPSGLVILGQEHDYVSQLEDLARAPVLLVPGRGLELSAAITRAVARHLEISADTVEAALASFEPPQGRLKLLRLTHYTVLDDSYNANPLSMKLGLEALDAVALPGQRKVAVLGDMTELGDEAARFHRNVGCLAARCADLQIGVGELARNYGFNQWYPTIQSCADQIQPQLKIGDCILVKGSHAMHMEHLVRRLQKLDRRGLHAPQAKSA